MHIRDVKKQTKANFKAGNSVLWKGPPGWAKTAVSIELFNEMAAEKKAIDPNIRCGLCRIFMATQSDVDATGLPWRAEMTINGKTYNVTKPAIPTWGISTDGIPAIEYDWVLLVLEEWGQGQLEAKRAFASIMLEKGTPGFYLPTGSNVLALSNVDASDGVTKEFDFIIGRRKEFTVTSSVQVWDEDFASKPYQHDGKTWNVSPLMRTFAQQRTPIFFEAKPKVQGPWCNPRSACTNDRSIQVMTADNGGKVPLEDASFQEDLQGGWGVPATQGFLELCQFQIELPSYEDVVAKPMETRIPKQADQLMLMAYGMAARTQSDDIGKVLDYISRKDWPKDMQITYTSSLLKRDYAGFINHPDMQSWIGRNASMMSIIGSLSQG
jgi:hypothetical protein